MGRAIGFSPGMPARDSSMESTTLNRVSCTADRSCESRSRGRLPYSMAAGYGVKDRVKSVLGSLVLELGSSVQRSRGGVGGRLGGNLVHTARAAAECSCFQIVGRAKEGG